MACSNRGTKVGLIRIDWMEAEEHDLAFSSFGEDTSMTQWLRLMVTRRRAFIGAVTGIVLFGCSLPSCDVPADDKITAGGKPLLSERDHRQHRLAMVKRQLRSRDIHDPQVLQAMQQVPRHEFVPKHLRSSAYADGPLPIGNGQTISQPYIVALMTQLGRPNPESRVLDVGTGSGYQAAVLAEIVNHVYSIEIVEDLADEASERLQRLGYDNIDVRCGDGYQGWEEHAPFDLIIVAAAPDHVPQPLIDQLAPGGRLIIPVGKYAQVLTMVEKKADGSTEKQSVAPVAFVPMTGQAEENR